jgi:hypothetical protein
MRLRGILLLVAVLLLGTATRAEAARLRFHYVATGKAPGPIVFDRVDAAEKISFFGVVREPYSGPPPKPTCQPSFRHPRTGETVLVPLALPDSTPRMEHRGNRVIYNYGSDTVEVVFLDDGTVDVVYNCGPRRVP